MRNESKPNHLIDQKSPYLQQHAYNPVDWYPWGQEAIDLAMQRDCPIFLSIGYASCHWCHVMEEESFRDEEVGAFLNKYFVSVKVDREERPDVDALYMEFAQSMMKGSLGWPLNLLLSFDLKPLFATTYLPKRKTRELLGLIDLLERFQEIWASGKREELLSSADQLVSVFEKNQVSIGREMPKKDLLDEGAGLLFKLSDPIFGGMQGAPKFPLGYQTNFMLRHAFITQESRSLFLVERSLEMMHRGGIFDHIGGGFCRYAIDEEWKIPHFEKMLYDNALLAHCYMETYKATKREFYKRVSFDIIHFVLREMSRPGGGYYSAIDADSEEGEGFYYTFTEQEINEVLEDNAPLFKQIYSVTAEGNFSGRNVLYLKESLEHTAQVLGKDTKELIEWDRDQKQKLFFYREKRKRPKTDDLIITSWNALMIRSLVKCGRAFSKSEFIDEAVKSASFIIRNMWKNKTLYRRYCDGEVLYKGGLEEYAFLISACIALFEAGLGSEWLILSRELTEALRKEFKEEGGAFYQTDGKDPLILIRRVHFTDGAEPSGNAVHAENLLKLWLITLEPQYLMDAEDIFKAVHPHLRNYPPGFCYHLIALSRYYDKKGCSFVISLNEANEGKEQIAKALASVFDPHSTVVWRTKNDKKLFESVPFYEELEPLEGKTTLYICKDGSCRAPINDLDEIIEAIKKH